MNDAVLVAANATSGNLLLRRRPAATKDWRANKDVVREASLKKAQMVDLEEATVVFTIEYGNGDHHDIDTRCCSGSNSSSGKRFAWGNVWSIDNQQPANGISRGEMAQSV